MARSHSKSSKSRVVIRHKEAECVGCAFCAEVIPQYFRLNDDGMAILENSSTQGVFKEAEGLAMDLEDIESAIKGCATNIISIHKK